MKSSITIGLFVGLLGTLAAAYYLQSTGRLSGDPESVKATAGETTEAEAKTMPMSPVLDNFSPNFPGDKDLMARRATLFPHITVYAWDRILAKLKIAPAIASRGCGFTESTNSISVPPLFVEAMRSGKNNVIILNRAMPQCFVQKNNIPVIVDDLINGKNLYQFLGELTINRVLDVDVDLRKTDPSLIRELGIEVSDIAFLMNTDGSPLRRTDEILVLQVSFRPTTALPDSAKIPSFVPGALAIHPENITGMAQSIAKGDIALAKPILIDARDRRNLTAGPSYAGAIQAPIVASSFAQLRFQLGLPTSVIAGAKFDVASLPASRDIPLIVYGNDETDASPLWVIRNLRLQNYRNLFFVVGGLKAMKELKQPIAL